MESETAVLGGGLAGLSAATALARANRDVLVLEASSEVGGLARTIVHGDFRFDLGGHRFVTEDPRIEQFVLELMGAELLRVRRASRILIGGRYVDYPLRFFNAVRGLGPSAVARIFVDVLARAAARRKPSPPVSLEDWVVRHYGRALFELYFKHYSEKVWGIPCERIAAEWIAQRIQGLSLGQAVTSAVVKSRGPRTLAPEFWYPALGIGRIAARLREEIEQDGHVFTRARIERIDHDGGRITGVAVVRNDQPVVVRAREYVSSLPLTTFVRLLHPRPPAAVLEAAAGLRFRDLIVVTVMLDRARVTDQTWIYFPEQDIPFGRLHEPTNWSAQMAPPHQTLLVTERFCFRGDPAWRAADASLADETVAHLAQLGFVAPGDVIGSEVVRVPNAYPLFGLGYRESCRAITACLDQLRNLHLAGRGGLFCYYNMDQAIGSGLTAAQAILARRRASARTRPAHVAEAQA